MKTLLLLSLFLLSLFQSMPTGNYSIDMDGNTGVVELYSKEGKLYGKLVESSNERAPLGTDILRGLEYDDGRWVGKIYSIKKDREAKVTVIQKEDELLLTVKAGIKKKKMKWAEL